MPCLCEHTMQQTCLMNVQWKVSSILLEKDHVFGGQNHLKYEVHGRGDNNWILERENSGMHCSFFAPHLTHEDTEA